MPDISKDKFRIETRDGKASLWIGDRNVWDIEHKHVTDRVLFAIENAYNIGRESAITDMRQFASKIKGGGLFKKFVDHRTESELPKK